MIMTNTIELKVPVNIISSERNSQNNNSIEINNVTVSFKTPKGIYTAVKDISLNVKKGEIVCIIGHSGCGKSTLMGTISGMVKPTSGTVFVNDSLITKPGPD